MNFDLTAEQEMIRRTIREFAEEEVAPGALERDRKKNFHWKFLKSLLKWE